MNSRRKFLKKTVLTTGLALTGCKMEQNKLTHQTSEKPNILYIITDQQCASAMSSAGNNDLKTPAMDSIAENGVSFEKAYCTQPLCVPSRVSMFTGKMPHETRVTYNTEDYSLAPSGKIIGKIMSDAGYDCGYVGKWHVTIRPENKQLHGFQTAHTTAAKGQRIKFGFKDNERGNSETDKDIPASCDEFIKRDRNKPFFMVASFTNPHDICQWARGDKLPNGEIPTLVNPEKCPELPKNFEIPENEPSIIRTHQKQAPRMYPTRNWENDKWRQYQWAYYRCTELVDSLIAKVLKSLQSSGQMENTVIIFTSDHGDGNSAHKWNQKMVLYDEPARIPVIITTENPKLKNTKDTTHIVSNGLDLIPTLCDYAQTAKPAGLRGRSLKPLAEKGYVENWRDFVVCETDLHHKYGTPDSNWGRMLRTKRYKYIVYCKGENREQLFDMEKDPGETTDLTISPKYKEELIKHRNILRKWCLQTDDTDFLPFIPNV